MFLPASVCVCVSAPKYLNIESSDWYETCRILLLGGWDKLIRFWLSCFKIPLQSREKDTKNAYFSTTNQDIGLKFGMYRVSKKMQLTT